jgi:hypothetical protein
MGTQVLAYGFSEEQLAVLRQFYPAVKPIATLPQPEGGVVGISGDINILINVDSLQGKEAEKFETWSTQVFCPCIMEINLLRVKP